MSAASYTEVLQAAQNLPLDNQVKLIEILLRNLRSLLRGKKSTSSDLLPLTDMSREELRVLANSVLAPSRQKKLQALLEKNRNGTLSTDEEMSLDQLLEEADQVALLKARAQYTLHLSNN
ncbi:MAG: hypothetical protein GY924_12220 [Planctomycetaceae bacterium]|nr:hypothetical protein [Planctomycetaceae bacterium]